MKILQFHRYLGAGGIEAMVCGLSNEMAKTEDVTVCTVIRPYESDVFYNKLSPLVKKATLDKHDERPPFKEIFKIVRFIKKGHYDVVHIHGFFYYYALAVLLLHKKTHFFFTAHNDALMENTPWDLRILWLKKWYFKKGWMHPVTISPASQESFYELYGCDSRMIKNGVVKPDVNTESDPMAKFRVTSRTKVFLNPGRICPQKNQGMLCRVFDRLIKDGEDVALVIAGPNHSQSIYDEIKAHFSERITYIGEQTDVPSLLFHSDAMCLSSEYEGLPVVLLEALSVGCIPVCTPVGGIVNVLVDHETGILSESCGESAYYYALKRFLAMTEDCLALMQKKCLDSFSGYDMEITAEEYLKYYREYLNNS